MDKATIIRLLRDYLRKLERDDFDPDAIRKMKETQAVIAELQEAP